MLRYFVAIPLPDDLTERLLNRQPPHVPGIRLIERQELHLTLLFLGELDPLSLELVQRALNSITNRPFPMTIRGIGSFPTTEQPQVLWAGVADCLALSDLHQAVGISLSESIGFHPEERPYSPHITLARVNKTPAPDCIKAYLKENQGLQIGTMTVDRFALYSSVLTNGPPQYRVESVYHF